MTAEANDDADQREVDLMLEVVSKSIYSVNMLLEAWTQHPPDLGARFFAFMTAWLGKAAKWDAAQLTRAVLAAHAMAHSTKVSSLVEDVGAYRKEVLR